MPSDLEPHQLWPAILWCLSLIFMMSCVITALYHRYFWKHKENACTQLTLLNQIKKNSVPENLEREEGNNNNNVAIAVGKPNDEHVREDIPRVIISPPSFIDSNKNPVAEQQLTTSDSPLSGFSRVLSDLLGCNGESSPGHSLLSGPGSLQSDEGSLSSLHSEMNLEDIPQVIVSPPSFIDSNSDKNPLTEQQLTTSDSPLSGSSRVLSDLSGCNGESSPGHSLLSGPGSLQSDEGSLPSLHSEVSSVLCRNDLSDSCHSCSTDSGCDPLSATGSLHSSGAPH